MKRLLRLEWLLLAALLLFIVLELADYASTIHALRDGYVELNPLAAWLLRRSPLLLLLGKVVECALAYVWMVLLVERAPRLALAVLLVLDMGLLVQVLLNLTR